MAHPENLLTLHNLGRLYGQRPSTFLGLDDPWLAYQVDVAAAQISQQPATDKKRFAPFAGLTKGLLRKVKVPENGIW